MSLFANVNLNAVNGQVSSFFGLTGSIALPQGTHTPELDSIVFRLLRRKILEPIYRLLLPLLSSIRFHGR